MGDWEIRLQNVRYPADSEVARANRYNPPPKGQYLLATFTGTYVGPDRTADVSMDVVWQFTDATGVVTNAWDQNVVTPANAEGWPASARNGATVRYQVAFDVPVGDLSATLLSATEFLGDDVADFNVG